MRVDRSRGTGEADDPGALQPRRGERRSTGRSGCAGRDHVVHQENRSRRRLSPVIVHLEQAAYVRGPTAAAETGLLLSGAGAPEKSN